MSQTVHTTNLQHQGVYDPNTLSWVNMQQPVLEGGTIILGAAVNQGTGGASPWLVTLAAGGSTEYTEDVASPANPVAAALSVRRRDTLAAETTTDGDWVTANATNKGEVYVKHADTMNVAGLSRTVSGAMTNVGDYLQLDTTGMGTLIGHAVTNDTATTYQIFGSIDGTNYYYLVSMLPIPNAVGAYTKMASNLLDVSQWVASGLTPQFMCDISGLVSIRFKRVVTSANTQTWALGTGIAPPMQSSVSLFGALIGTSTPTAINANASGGLRVDASNEDLTIRGTFLDPGVSTYGIATLGLFNDGLANLSSGDRGVLRQTSRRALHTNLRNNTGTEIGVAGSALIVDGSAVTQPVSAVSLPLPTGAATLAGQTQPGVDIGDVTVNNAAGASAVNIQDGGNSITIDGTVAATNAALSVVGGGAEATALRVTVASDSTGVLSVDDNGGSLTVDAVSLPLPTGAATLAGQTQPGIDIGDVTINNAAAASAVNIQDGGNSLTIDALNLDVALSTLLKPADTLTAVTTLGSITSALPAGTNLLGKVSTDQTTHGTSDLVAADITKVGGTAIALGQALAAASFPVVLTAAQITSLTPPTTITVSPADTTTSFDTTYTQQLLTEQLAVSYAQLAFAANSQDGFYPQPESLFLSST